MIEMERDIKQIESAIFKEEVRGSKKTQDKSRFPVQLAWFLLAVSAIVFLMAVVLLLLIPNNEQGSFDYGFDYQIGFILLSYSALGALIASRHTRNPIGWIFIVMGLGSELHILAIGYFTYANFRTPNSIHFPLLLFTLLVNPFIIQRALGPLGLLLFPDGKFLSPRWKIIAWVPVGLGVIWYLFSTPAPVAGLQPAIFQSIVQSVFPAISSTVSTIIETATSSLIEVFFVIAAVGIVLRLRQAKDEQREQLKWFVYATVLTATITLSLTILDYLPINLGLFARATDAGRRITALLPDLAYVLIPLAASIAIYKYHLYDIDLIINRTLVYVPLTAILAGLYAASVTLFQRLFIASTGQKSDAAVVMSTLILASTFTPIKNRLQDVVDKRFKEAKDPLKDLKEFGKQVEAVAGVLNTQRTTRRLLDISVAAYHASSGAIYIHRDGKNVLEHSYGDWKEGNGVVRLPMIQDGIQLGSLMLGARTDHKSYTVEDREILQREVNRVAELIWLKQAETRFERFENRRENYDPDE